MLRVDQGLLVSRNQVELAKMGGSKGFLVMNPQLFLELTVPNQATYNWIAADTKSMETYNKFTLNGISKMPEMVLDLDTQQVYRHDGRHRARSLINAGITAIPVALYCRRNGLPVYDWDVGDLPPSWCNQFNAEIKHCVPKDRWHSALCFLAITALA